MSVITTNVMTTTTTRPAIGIQPAGYRMPDEVHIGRVRLQISDLGASTLYYTRVLGFSVLDQRGGVAVLGRADGSALTELHERRGAQPVPRRGRIGLYHFAILLPDR